jgi:hypothetical protein
MIEWAQIRDKKTIKKMLAFRVKHGNGPFTLEIWKRIYRELGEPVKLQAWAVVGKTEDDGSKPEMYVLKGVPSPRALALMTVEEMKGLPIPVKEIILQLKSQANELSDKTSVTLKVTDKENPGQPMYGFKTGLKYDDVKKAFGDER